MKARTRKKRGRPRSKNVANQWEAFDNETRISIVQSRGRVETTGNARGPKGFLPGGRRYRAHTEC